MKTSKGFILLMVILPLTAAILTGCGGGGGGGGSAPLLPAAYNVNGTWNVTETASAQTVCDKVIVASGTPDLYQLQVVHTGLQNNLTVHDTRSQGLPQPASISDKTISYSGSRFDPWGTNCPGGLIESAMVTLSTASNFSGTGAITCPNVCTVPTTIVGTR